MFYRKKICGTTLPNFVLQIPIINSAGTLKSRAWRENNFRWSYIELFYELFQWMFSKWKSKAPNAVIPSKKSFPLKSIIEGFKK